MKITLWNIGKSLNRWKSKVLGLSIAYSSGVVINLITEAKTIPDLVGICGSLNRPAILLMWIFLVFTIIIYLAADLINSYNKKQTPSAVFRKIMMAYTAPELREYGRNELSWGYNKNIHRSKEPGGWLPEAFSINSYVDNSEYQFPITEGELPGYTKKQYLEFLKSETARTCIEKDNNQERFAAVSIEPNFNRNNRKVAINLMKTHWLPLQFSWDYFRLLDLKNDPIEDKSNKEAICRSIERVFMDATLSNQYQINSFCLHLIIETPDGKAVLSRISRNKQNDYPSTWAATLGEQLELKDFYNESTSTLRHNFVLNWTKRALLEELRIDPNVYADDIPELEEYFDMQSLRVLSVDFEGDIYNIALTAVLRLKMDIESFIANRSNWIDQEELTEFKVCDLADIRNILLHYPSNSHDFHPSTYLRLLMFHLYKTGSHELCNSICKDFKQLPRS
ncbi:MAG: hypothetical protein IJQ95_00295 [Paludibacteraceae bacterium]|nr:hypothetical protein [Paludibacteraceae bacterium]